ncbi:E3 ubiquitin-protein ligase RNF25 [Condylostylus longicornis]|uniref:E3 ubiquitin-protein ligase RNF25 n=1 Tax=Condylostylus longicornis TaxID=2530218 RepID=UPI00244DEF20|nr:E3 ubiquitin-protein ligase RNF25 [Condylostylus longicornis]
MDSLIDEVESLEAILMEDVKIHRNSQTNVPEIIETTIFPIGTESDRYICVTLQVIPSSGYPEISPKFNLLKPRGLDDQRLNEIKSACVTKLNESLGYPVVFDLIEVVREHLTGSNLPSGQCVICLYGFQEGDEFIKTECFHYLHSFCLARHLVASKRNWQEEINKLPAWLKKTAEAFQAVCPVCREKIPDNVDALRDAKPPSELENAPDFELTKDLKELQQRMSNLFLRQKSRGAIIDISAEEKNVISIETEDQMLARLEQERARKLAATQAGQKHMSDAASSIANGEEINENGERNVPNPPNGQNCNNTSNNSASSSRITVNHTNFAPIINTAPTRYSPAEPTNNNYNHQYNRRHFRGGNRRFHRDRDRFRGERDQQQQQQQISEENGGNISANNPTTNITESNSNSSGTANGKGRYSSGKNQKSGSHKR